MIKLVTILFLFLAVNLFAQVSITTGNVILIDFNSYGGSGFTSTPAAGQLDSDEWAHTGMSNGALAYGGTGTTGDHARGSSTGGVTTGGFYAFDVGGGNIAFGIQPGGSDWTPGTVTLRFVNNTGATLTKFNLSYDVYTFNDQDRANSVNLSYSEDDVAYTSVGSLDYTSPEVADGGPAWSVVSRSTNLTGLNVANGAFLYIRWEGNDETGSGSRDEFAIDNILSSEGDTPLPIELTSFVAISGDKEVVLRWSTASEIDNQGYAVLRANDKEGAYDEIDSYKTNGALKGAGNSSGQNDYQFIDNSVFNDETYWYKLVDVDLNGVRTEHGPIYATPHSAEVEAVNTFTPETFALAQNKPNPFNPSTTIEFAIPELREGAMRVTLAVFDLLGKKVATLYDGMVDAGSYKAVWNGFDQVGKQAPSGIYIYQINSENFSQSKRMLLLK